MIKRIINWFRTSHRFEHLLGGVAIGAAAMSVYGAIYAGLLVSSTLELKDKLWGGKWDWIDWSLTIVGVIIGQAFHQILHYAINKEIKWV